MTREARALGPSAGRPTAPVLDARAAQRTWVGLDLEARAALLERMAHLLADDADLLAADLSQAQGRPALDVWSSEIVPTLDALRWLARHGVRALSPRRLRRSWLQWYFRATRHELRWEPHGVIGVVTPGNSLLFLAVPQIAAALLGGNAVVWKPSPWGVAVAHRVAGFFDRAGLPPGLLRVVEGGPEAAREIVTAGVDKLHFTGGSAAGSALLRLQAEAGRPAVLELSGRHASVVLGDANIELAARGIVWGKRANGGRNCISVQLALVERGAAPAFLAAVARMVDASPEPAPEAAAQERTRWSALVTDAVDRGARLVASGVHGLTVLADVTPDMRVVDEEIQGPILAVSAVESVEQAIRQINRSEHRLSASVWSSDPARARHAAERLDVGQVWINDQLHPAAQPEVTLAGRGASGFGATRGLPGLMEMVQPKVISETPPGAARRHYAPASEGALDLFRATVRLGLARSPARRLAALALMLGALARLGGGRR